LQRPDTGAFTVSSNIIFILTQTLKKLIGVVRREGVIGDINNTSSLNEIEIAGNGQGMYIYCHL